MNIFLFSTLLFFFALIIHIILWRIRTPQRNHSLTLLIVFCTVLIFGTMLIIVYQQRLLATPIPVNIYQWMHAILLYGLLSAAYIISYSAIEAISPSVGIVLLIARAGSEGIRKENLYTIFDNNYMLIPRIHELLSAHLAVRENHVYKLSKRGKCFVTIFLRFRNLLGASRGG